MTRALTAVLVGIVIVAACRTTTEGRRGATGMPASADVIQLRLDERYVDPAGGLEIQPISIGVDRATLAVRVDGIARTLTVRSGSIGRQRFSPYTFELSATSLEPSVTLLVTRE
jgi:hypothetical protein